MFCAKFKHVPFLNKLKARPKHADDDDSDQPGHKLFNTLKVIFFGKKYLGLKYFFQKTACFLRRNHSSINNMHQISGNGTRGSFQGNSRYR